MAELTDLDGVAEGRASNMKEAGYETIEDVATADPEELAESVNYLPEDTALELVVQAGNMLDDEVNSEDASESDTEDADESEEEDGPLPGELAEDESDESSDDSERSQFDGPTEEEKEAMAEPYALTVDLRTPMHYDAYMTALLNAVERRFNANQEALDALEKVLGDARYNDGTVEHELTAFELNTLHGAVSQQVTTYKGLNMIGYMDATRELLEQIDEVRSEKLF